jgi:class 3 adenylate cyclase/tetratricopeptide (TPR) repeat protein
MPCAACGHANRAHAKFCEECGAALTAPSAAPPDPRAYTPRHLIERILTSRAALQGERKPVTVLFVDVQGSMALAERVDPEEWHAIMNQFFTILSEGVHRFEGSVNQYTGDGVMALFGAPLAYEDHAQRACYAALHLIGTLREYAQVLRRERGLQFSVRMGLNSGEVVVGAIGDDLRMDYTAQGHTVGLASRMEQLCEPGRVYTTEHTAALVAGYFDFEDLGLFTIKGVREPLRAFALLRQGPLRTRLDVARARGLSRFIGRDRELALLDAAFSAAAASQPPPATAVIAEAGVGKSRLCAEFCERWRGRGAAVVETQGLAHGAALPYLPVLTLLRQLLGIGERDAPETARQKIAGSLLLLDDGFKERLPMLFDFLGVPDPTRGASPSDPETRMALLVDTCVSLLRGRAARQPAVVLVEDLHWFDAASDVFIRRLVAALAAQPVVVVLNARPEYDADWLREGGFRRIDLQPLGMAAIAELLDELLGRDPSLGDLGARLGARAAGNPFFAEELVQSLAQSGALTGTKGTYRLARSVDESAIPTSVRAVLAARIDRLAARDKDVLQTAAVIGKEFDESVLRAVTGLAEAELGAALRSLAGAELVFARCAYPVSEYAFKHPLTQEVAYGTQLATRRTRLHAGVARALAAPMTEPSGERPVLVAYHWERAGEAWEAAQWQHRAARALMGTDTREAQARLRRVLALLGELPESAPAVALALQTYDDLLRAGSLGGLAREDADQLFASGRALAEQAGDRSALTRLFSTFGEFLFFSGHGADAQRYLREATELARDVDDAAVKLTVLVDKAQTAFWAGRLREVLKYTEEALPRMRAASLAKEIPVGLWGEAFGLSQRGLALSFMGRRREGAADLGRAIRLADQHGSLESRCVARQFSSLAALMAGEVAVALTHAHTSLELAVRAGNPVLERLAQASLGSAYVSSGRAEEGLATLVALTGESAGASLGAVEWMLLPVLAEAHRAVGDTSRAIATGTRAVEVAHANGALTSEAVAQLALAAALIGVDPLAHAAAIDAALVRAAALIEESGFEALRPRLHAVRIDRAQALGDRDGAWRELRAATRICREMGMDELADRMARELAVGDEA